MTTSRRDFLKGAIIFFPAAAALQHLASVCAAAGDAEKPAYDPKNHYYGMGVEIDKCIGCNRCVEACKTENKVPPESYYTRTWVERYSVLASRETVVETVSRSAENRSSPRRDAKSGSRPIQT